MDTYSNNCERSRIKDEEPRLETPEKRSREVGCGELDFRHSSPFAEVRKSVRRRLMIEAHTESLSSADGLANSGPSTAAANEEEANSSSEPASCSSNYASIQLVEDLADPTGHTGSALEETLTFSGGRYNRSDMESAKSGYNSAVKEMPSEVEVEDFLSTAENDLQKRFKEKYNFDAVKGVPLKGRYEWVPVKP